jgi:hypothetical protein
LKPFPVKTLDTTGMSIKYKGNKMMYNNKLVACIKQNNKVLREDKDVIHVPFGTEYSIFLKNLSNLRCLVTIEIDGSDIAEGEQFVIHANSSINIERFMKNGNKDQGNKFKFIERTAKIENGSRGIKVEDGIIRIEFEFEKEVVKTHVHHEYVHHYHDYYWPYRSPNWDGQCYNYGILREIGQNINVNTNLASSNSNSNSDVYTQAITPQAITPQAITQANFQNYSGEVKLQSENGITVAGEVSDQKFTEAAWFATDGTKHTMVFKLFGMVGDKSVEIIKTVKSKKKCQVCDHVNKSSSKFCVECGAALEIV